MGIGRFPLLKNNNVNTTKKFGILDIISEIVRDPPPKVPEDSFTPLFQDFVRVWYYFYLFFLFLSN